MISKPRICDIAFGSSRANGGVGLLRRDPVPRIERARRGTQTRHLALDIARSAGDGHRRSASRGGNRARIRRALRDARADHRRDDHRGGAHHVDHAQRQGRPGACPRHGLLGDHDRLQWHCRPLRSRRRLSVPGAGFRGQGRERLPCRAHRAFGSDARSAELHQFVEWADADVRATCFRIGGDAPPVWRFSVHPDGKAPGIFYRSARRSE